MCEARFAIAGIAEPGTISPSPRPGRDDLPRLSARTRCWDQAGCIAVPSDDQRLGAVDPHPVQDDGKFSSHGDAGFAQAPTSCDAHAPGLESRPFRNPRQQHIGSFVEVAPQHSVAAFGDPTSPVSLAGRVSSGRQSHVGSNTARFFEPRRIIDRRQVAKRRDRAHAWHGHEATHLRHATRQTQDLAIQISNLPPDSFSCLEQRLDSGGERRLPSISSLARAVNVFNLHRPMTSPSS